HAQREPCGGRQWAVRPRRPRSGDSRRHGEGARERWRGLRPGRAGEGGPSGDLTNGVHVPSWIGPPMRELLDRHLGEGWMQRAADPHTWAGVDAIPDEELWAVRNEQRRRLVEYVRERSVLDRIARGEPREYAAAAARGL